NAALYDEDNYNLERIDEFVGEGGVGLKLTIKRAAVVRLVLYGKPAEIRTQAKTVGELMQEKQIILQAEDGSNVSPDTPVTNGLALEVWRNGVQTVTTEEEVAFTTKFIRDTDKPVGFKEIQQPGIKGKKMVTYQIEMRNGREVGRTLIQQVSLQEPKQQVEIVGAKSSGGLSKSKGVNFFIDSQGINHRETYYDLKMDIVMRACGGGAYSVREDGAKVDSGGYILVAANLNRYPRCSVVETSLGLGKVYDTGGFASVHPDGFDLATDWSNYDGR
ncbi:MAG TPA: G5 domain-containing protein, partial [Magnetospirillaceae bacterium]|nr:G5 domain-containing protein [Magnetospirillaceae bacterium]